MPFFDLDRPFQKSDFQMDQEKFPQEPDDDAKEQVINDIKSDKLRFIYFLIQKYKNKKNRDLFIAKNKERIQNMIKIAKKVNGEIEQACNNIPNRSKLIPMLEIEACLLTTKALNRSLYLHNLLKSETKSQIEYDQMFESVTIKDMNSIFTLPFNTKVELSTKFNEFLNTLDEEKDKFYISRFRQKFNKFELTHAHVVVFWLSLNDPDVWINFIECFKNTYIHNPESRFHLLFYLSIWFELRPKHFLKFFSWHVDFIESVNNDQGLLCKHFILIFEEAKRNVKFKFLQLDSIPSDLHLKYVQFSDYHKNIFGSDIISIQNTFTSNILKKNQPFHMKNLQSNDTRPNEDDFVQAFIILLNASLYTLSLDAFISKSKYHVINDFIPKQILEWEKKIRTLDFEKTNNLKKVMKKEEFDYWSKETLSINCNITEIEKLRSLLSSIPKYIDSLLKLQNEELLNLLSNIKSMMSKIKIYDEFLSQFFGITEHGFELINQNQKILSNIKDEYQQLIVCINNESPYCFFTKYQQMYFNFIQNATSFKNLDDKISTARKNAEDIMILMCMKSKLKGIHMKGIQDVNLDEKNQQFVDPWAIRVVSNILTASL